MIKFNKEEKDMNLFLGVLFITAIVNTFYMCYVL